MSKSVKTVKKSLVRNTETTNASAKVLKCNPGKIAPETNLADPSINSTKSILRELRRVEENEYKKCGIEGLNDNDKMGLNKKITSKMNFHIDDQVYRNLVALNIGDTEAKSQSRKSLSTPKYVPKITKDIEPNLKDFYRHEVKVDKPILPPSVKVKHKPIIKYGTSDIMAWDLQPF